MGEESKLDSVTNSAKQVEDADGSDCNGDNGTLSVLGRG